MIAKSLLQFFLALLTCHTLFGQSFPASEVNPEWTYKNDNIFPIETISISTDSVVAAHNRRYNRINYRNLDDNISQTVIYGYYRIEGNKVYISESPDPASERLQYDFDLVEGDTIRLAAPNDFGQDYVLYEILEKFSFSCNNDNYNAWRVSFDYTDNNSGGVFTYNSLWIEGFGDVFHPFLGLTCLSPTCEEIPFDLRLKVDQDTLKASEFTQCINLVSTNSIALPESTSIYPNPTNGNLYIYLFESNYEIEEWEVVNNMGAQLIHGLGSLTKIDLSMIPKGTYFLKLRFTNGKYLTKKLMKQ